MIASQGFHFTKQFSPHGGRKAKCKCEFMAGYEGKTKVEGYDPMAIKEQWRTAREIRLELDLDEWELKELFNTLGIESLDNVSAIDIIDGFVEATAKLGDGVSPTIKNIASEMLADRSVGAKKLVGYKDYVDTVDAVEKPEINVAKQMQHVKGSREYVDRLSNGDIKGYFVDMPYDDLVKMIEENIGKGDPVFNTDGKWKRIEVVEMDFVVGYAYNLSSGLYEPVHGFTIRYSKSKGIHAVPKFLEDVDDATQRL